MVMFADVEVFSTNDFTWDINTHWLPEEVPTMNQRASILGASLLVLVLLVSFSQATQIIYRSPKQMGDESSLVVLGKVARVRSYWNENRTKIFTETLVEIDEMFKGATVPNARIVQLGGVVGNVRMTVHGALRWKPGEEVLLFLEPYEQGTYQVSGFSQGKFAVERDPVTRKPYVKAPVFDGKQMLQVPAEGSAVQAPKETKVPLHRFVKDALGLQ